MKCNKCSSSYVIGGASITEYTCTKCNRTFMYMLTNTPKVCPVCSKKYKLCEICGEKIKKERKNDY